MADLELSSISIAIRPLFSSCKDLPPSQMLCVSPGVSLQIPLGYDDLASQLHLPSLQQLAVDESLFMQRIGVIPPPAAVVAGIVQIDAVKEQEELEEHEEEEEEEVIPGIEMERNGKGKRRVRRITRRRKYAAMEQGEQKDKALQRKAEEKQILTWDKIPHFTQLQTDATSEDMQRHCLSLGHGVSLQIPPMFEDLSMNMGLPRLCQVALDERLMREEGADVAEMWAAMGMLHEDMKKWSLEERRAQEAAERAPVKRRRGRKRKLTLEVAGLASREGATAAGEIAAAGAALGVAAATAGLEHLLHVGDATQGSNASGAVIKKRRRRRRRNLGKEADGRDLQGMADGVVTEGVKVGANGEATVEAAWRPTAAAVAVVRPRVIRVKQGGVAQLLRKQKEEADRIAKCWAGIAKRDIPKHQRAFVAFHRKTVLDQKRAAELCQREVRSLLARSQRSAKAAPGRMKRLTRDMVLLWKRVEREQADLRKREEREAMEARRREEEMREARRQQQRLNFLLTQTELYSHFMHSKKEPAAAATAVAAAAAHGGGKDELPTTAAAELAVMPGSGKLDAVMGGISEDEKREEEALMQEAERAAEAAASAHWSKTNAFDEESRKLRDGVGGGSVGGQSAAAAAGAGAADGSEDLDLLNPSTMLLASSVQQPSMFQGSLKEYQLKGLQWLVSLYEQGLNGILADEMGLGKTIQAMSFLAHLAEAKGIWGPFLVIAPASVLSNWADELSRFLPAMKALPYWGGQSERAILRRNINPKRLYRQDAPFHTLITSYQLLVTDEKYLRRIKWQYMVLDEAQAIKSASSLRWKTLLSFNCRNRLLLTGTPIQNSMAELWALLHFIMPTLFDSHDQFNEWFSKGIENHAEHGGTLNQHQLSRLHSILKPFMLRRVKKDVEAEMGGKREEVVACRLQSRQQAMYSAIKNKISLADLLDSAGGAGGGLNEKKMMHLMNIVIQLRKVCNHPELFERNEPRSFLLFSPPCNPLQPAPFGDLDWIHWAGQRSPITMQIPKLLYREGMPCLPSTLNGSADGFNEKWLGSLLNVFHPSNTHGSIFQANRPPSSGPYLSSSFSSTLSSATVIAPSPFSFSRLIGLSAQDLFFAASAAASLLQRLVFGELMQIEQCLGSSFLDEWEGMGDMEAFDGSEVEEDEINGEGDIEVFVPESLGADDWLQENESRLPRLKRARHSSGHRGKIRFLLLVAPKTSRLRRPQQQQAVVSDGHLSDGGPFCSLPLVMGAAERMLKAVELLRCLQVFVPLVLAPMVDFYCSDRSFAFQLQEMVHHPWTSLLLSARSRTNEARGPFLPLPPSTFSSTPPLLLPSSSRQLQRLFPRPLMWPVSDIFGSSPPMQMFDFAKILTDSGKLLTLDRLLKKLKEEGHRVLIFAQMTKMLNILEDYVKYRKYKYRRLDGSSSIMDRREMVKDYQQSPDIFVFLLSTRAGGLGINLTAADTVIFYESDWNPTMDLQAMDRAHRLGQTREVVVYRMICEGTVEEKIVKRAAQKNMVQQLVMRGGTAGAGDVLEAEEVVSLLLDDAELEKHLQQQRQQQQEQPNGGKQEGKRKRARASKRVRLDAEGVAMLEEEAGEGSMGGDGSKGGEGIKGKAEENRRKMSAGGSGSNGDAGETTDQPLGNEVELEVATNGAASSVAVPPKPPRKRARQSNAADGSSSALPPKPKKAKVADANPSTRAPRKSRKKATDGDTPGCEKMSVVKEAGGTDPTEEVNGGDIEKSNDGDEELHETRTRADKGGTPVVIGNNARGEEGTSEVKEEFIKDTTTKEDAKEKEGMESRDVDGGQIEKEGVQQEKDVMNFVVVKGSRSSGHGRQRSRHPKKRMQEESDAGFKKGESQSQRTE